MDIEMEDKLPLDLDAYASNYRGQMKVLRLQQIVRSTTSPALQGDALRMAYNEVLQNTQNVELFNKICQTARELNIQGCEEDHQWLQMVCISDGRPTAVLL
jgi:hypothetical protein